LASVFEALVGAIYLDGGFEVSRAFIRREFELAMDVLKTQADFERDYKTRLQEIVQKKDKETPRYELINRILGSVLALLMYKYFIENWGFYGAAWGQSLSWIGMGIISLICLVIVKNKKYGDA
jgi:dsRNA-specific ribonuclease